MADGFKKYILMHRELSVARMVLDEATGLITAVNAIDNAEHLPSMCGKASWTVLLSTSGGWAVRSQPAVPGFAMHWKN